MVSKTWLKASHQETKAIRSLLDGNKPVTGEQVLHLHFIAFRLLHEINIDDTPIGELNLAMEINRDITAAIVQICNRTALGAKELESGIVDAQSIAWKQASAKISQAKTVTDEKQEKPKRPRKAATINARMSDEILNNPASHGWTVTKWQQLLKCSRGAVHKTEAWRKLEMMRMQHQAEHAMSRVKNKRPAG